MRQYLKLGSIFLALLLVLGCSTKEQNVITTISTSQKAYIYDGKKQKELIDETIQLNKYTKYAYDTDKYGKDHWNPTALEEVKQLQKDITKGVSTLLKNKVEVDCEDTMFLMVRNLMNIGYPADQIWYVFYLVPPSEVSGVVNTWGGHAVAVVDLEGSIPQSLEQRSKSLTVKFLTEELHYYVIARCRADKSLLTGWKYIDKIGYWSWATNKLDYEDVINTPNYQRYIKYVNTIYNRKDFE